jgi:hypothetical protein
MSYIYPNYKTKKAAKQAIADGQTVTCKRNCPWGQESVMNGKETIEGPHYPEPHKWYGQATIKDGIVIKLT